MKINYFSKSILEQQKELNLKKLEQNIKIITKEKNVFSKYIIKLYKQFEKNLKNNSTSDTIYSNLEKYYGDKLCNISDNNKLIKKSFITLSPSHADTYYVIKELNNKKENLMIICFDMHCDTYDSTEELWKGNVFSKLLIEDYISSFISVGVPKYKIKMTENSISKDVKNKVKILKYNNIKKYIKKYKPKIIFISIDIDCFNSYKKCYTALEYSPYWILNNLSHVTIKEQYSSEKINAILKNCIFIKNQYGYKNLYHVGENYMSVKKLKKQLKLIKRLCLKKNIRFGFNNNNNLIIADITELNGFDLNKNTSKLVINLIDIIKEVR